MDVIERDDDGVTWINGEAYTPLTDRERTFLDVTVEAQKERDAARQQLRGAVEALAELVRLKDGPRDDAYRAAKDAAWDEARAVLARRGGQ